MNLTSTERHKLMNIGFQILKNNYEKAFGLLILSVFLTSTIDVFAQTVYTNKTDSKFHLLTCKYLDPSHDSLDMAFALKKGLGACAVCKPSARVPRQRSMGTPSSMGAPKSMEKSGMAKEGIHLRILPVSNAQSLRKMGKDALDRSNPEQFIAGTIEIIRNNPSSFIFRKRLLFSLELLFKYSVLNLLRD